MAPAGLGQADRGDAVLARHSAGGLAGGGGRCRCGRAGDSARCCRSSAPTCRRGAVAARAGRGGDPEGRAAASPLRARNLVRQRHRRRPHHGCQRSLRRRHRGRRSHRAAGSGRPSRQSQGAAAQPHQRQRRSQRQAQRQRGGLLAPAGRAVAAGQHPGCARGLRASRRSGTDGCRGADAGGRPAPAHGQPCRGGERLPPPDRARRRQRCELPALSRPHHAGRRARRARGARCGDGGLRGGPARGEGAAGARCRTMPASSATCR